MTSLEALVALCALLDGKSFFLLHECSVVSLPLNSELHSFEVIFGCLSYTTNCQEVGEEPGNEATK